MWDIINKNKKKDDYAFLFKINLLQNFYGKKGKAGIFCDINYGPAFDNMNQFEYCFQDGGKALENKNRDETGYDANYNSFDYTNRTNVLSGKEHYYTLKDYEVFELSF